MAAPCPSTGQVLGHFRLLERIGEGGMGIVFRARDLRLERDVAIKILNHKMLGDPSGRKRFRHEALVLSRLNHPNVELVYEFPDDESIAYIVMEYVPGVSLDDRLEKGPLPGTDVVELGVQLARGLAAAHARGIVHRDLKPGNLRITPERVLKILDFGLAQLFALPDDETVTQSIVAEHSVAGTIPYMSPEQLQGKTPDTRSDVYSAGVVLYEMATGKRPFSECGEGLRQAIMTAKPIAPRQSAPKVSPRLESAILRCLEKDPNLRFQSASELLAELAQVAAEQNIAVARTRSTSIASGTKKKIWASISAAVLLVAAVCAFLFWRTPQAEAHQKIMAVLPFDEVGQNAATNALAAGLMETVSTRLVEAGNDDLVEVVSPHELRERGVKTAADARREFGTDMVLEGSLQEAGEQLRITCNLVDSKTGRQIGARTVTRDTSDIFGLQDEAVQAALDILADVRIKVRVTDATARQPETQPAAYQSYIRGRGYLQEYEKPENIDNAIAAFNEALKVDPNFAPAYAALGSAYWRAFRPPSNRGREWLEKASQSCTSALEIAPELPEGHTCLGNVLYGTGKYEDAVAQYQRALKSDPTDDETLLALADAYSALGNASAAEETYKKAISLRPNYWRVYNWLAIFYYKQNRYADAAAMFRKVTQLAPDNYRGYANLGGICIVLGEYQQAVETLQRSVELRPTADAYNNLGYSYILMHRYPEAVTVLERALKENGNRWEIWGNLGDALYWTPQRRGEAAANYQKAIAIASSSLEVNPRDAETLAYLATYSAMLGDQKAAMKYLGKSLELAPTDGEVLFRAAVVYSHSKQPEQALGYLKGAVESGYSKAVVRDTPDFQFLKHEAGFETLMTGS